MKKNRPGIKVEVICPPEKKATLTRRLFSETTTIGVRYQKVHRYVLKRSFAMVTTRFGDIQVKCTTDHRGRKRCVPEYEHCRQLALEKDIPLKLIYDAVADATVDDDSGQEADS
jgi:hypothetical protein